MSRPFGWCNDGHHSGCPSRIQTFYLDEKTHKAVVTGTRDCGCSCHEDGDET